MFDISFYDQEINRRKQLNKDYLGKALILNGKFSFINQGAQIDQNPVVLFIGPTTKAVRRTFADAGFVTNDSDLRFNIMWGTPQSLDWMERLQPGQMTAHIAGQYCIVRKDSLAETLERACRRNEVFRIAPKSFFLPEQLQNFKLYAQMRPGFYIVKRATAARGEGVKLVHSTDEFKAVEAVVQEYIPNPLLIGKRKFDLRLYVCVTSLQPLTVYLYKEGLTRFASQEYEQPTQENKRSKQIHLTNYSVNKEAGLEIDEYKWSFSQVLTYLDQQRDQFALPNQLQDQLPSELVLERIEKVIKLTLIAAEPELYSQSLAKNLLGLPNKQFGFYGFDLMILDDLQVKLVEVNVTPSTATEHEVDNVKFLMLRDMLQLVGVPAHIQQKELVIPKMKSKKSSSVGLREEIPEFRLKPGEKRWGDGARFQEKCCTELREQAARQGAWKRLLPDSKFNQYFEVQRKCNLIDYDDVK